MPYLHIEDFRNGLDTRKSIYTAPPGSLRELKNGHITRGAEIEKRKEFTSFATLPTGTFGLHSVRGELWTFGSGATPLGMPANVRYQRLQHKDGTTSMSRILSVDNFDGKIYAVAEFTDGAIYHYYNGNRVLDWDTISATISDNAGVASALANKITANTSFPVTTSASTLTVTAPVAGTAFTYSTAAVNGGATNDQTLSSNKTQDNRKAVAEELAVGSFRVTGGTSSPATNGVSSVKVDGVEILGAFVDWTTSNSNTAKLVADQINLYTSTVEYTASVDGDKVIITALAGTGSAPNGFVVAATPGGDVTVGDVTNMGGGVDAVTAQAQIVEFTVGGTFEADDQFKITLDGEDFVVRGGAAGTGTAILTYQDKVYAVTQSSIYFSGFRGNPPLPDPTAWDGATGSGFINISTQTGGAEDLSALGAYQSYLAVFSQRTVQIWAVNADPAGNQIIQSLSNIGTLAARSVTSFGDLDVFFLSESGVRSLRARDSSNLASAQDVGTPVDGEIVDYMLGVAEDTRNRAVSAVEPLSGRFWTAIGPRIYIFSHFPGSDVAAWSTYELSADVTDITVSASRVYLRAGNVVYQYGGADGKTYDSTPVEVELPFLDFGLPGTVKRLHSLDIGAEGTWEIWLRQDPNNPEFEEKVGEISGSTYGLQGVYDLQGESTHFSLRLKSKGAGYARLGNVILHYNKGDAL